jgi:SGNH hydrolase-like domain, acetyltransferase AlgX
VSRAQTLDSRIVTLASLFDRFYNEPPCEVSCPSRFTPSVACPLQYLWVTVELPVMLSKWRSRLRRIGPLGSVTKKSTAALIVFLLYLGLGALAFYWSGSPSLWRHTFARLIFAYLVLWGAMSLWSTASKGEQAHRFLLTSASIALIVAVLELFVAGRVLDFRTIFHTTVGLPWHHPDNLLDPTLLHIHKPYDRWLWNGMEYRYDKYGLRNDVDMDVADVVVIGDSFVEGVGVSSDDLMTTHMAKYLNRSVANLGQSWYGPQQELELVRRYGVRLSPKVYVWVFFEGNDLDDISRYKWATQDWKTFSKGFHSFDQRSFTMNALLAIGRLLASTYTAQIQEDSDQAENDTSGVLSIPTRPKTRLHFHYKGHYLSLGDYAALEDLRAVLTQAYQLCHAEGAQFLVVFAPTKFRVYKSFVEFDPQAESRYWVLNDLPKEIEAIVHESIPDSGFLDLTIALTEQVLHRPLLYFGGYDTHWSPEGHEVAAMAIAHFLSLGEKGQ